MLTNQNVGAPVTWSIGPAGGVQDLWPARLAEAPRFGVDDRGKQGLVATIITLQKNLAGVEFIGERIVQVRYLLDRTKRTEALDGTKDTPLTIQELIAKRQASVQEYLATRTETQSVEALLSTLED
jgi:hypothetical protein